MSAAPNQIEEDENTEFLYSDEMSEDFANNEASDFEDDEGEDALSAYDDEILSEDGFSDDEISDDVSEAELFTDVEEI